MFKNNYRIKHSEKAWNWTFTPRYEIWVSLYFLSLNLYAFLFPYPHFIWHRMPSNFYFYVLTTLKHYLSLFYFYFIFLAWILNFFSKSYLLSRLPHTNLLSFCHYFSFPFMLDLSGIHDLMFKWFSFIYLNKESLENIL